MTPRYVKLLCNRKLCCTFLTQSRTRRQTRPKVATVVDLEVTEHRQAVLQANMVLLREDTALHHQALPVASSMADLLLRVLAMVNLRRVVTVNPKVATLDNRAVTVDSRAVTVDKDNRADMASSKAATVLPLPLLDTKYAGRHMWLYRTESIGGFSMHDWL